MSTIQYLIFFVTLQPCYCNEFSNIFTTVYAIPGRLLNDDDTLNKGPQLEQQFFILNVDKLEPIPSNIVIEIISDGAILTDTKSSYTFLQRKKHTSITSLLYINHFKKQIYNSIKHNIDSNSDTLEHPYEIKEEIDKRFERTHDKYFLFRIFTPGILIIKGKKDLRLFPNCFLNSYYIFITPSSCNHLPDHFAKHNKIRKINAPESIDVKKCHRQETAYIIKSRSPRYDLVKEIYRAPRKKTAPIKIIVEKMKPKKQNETPAPTIEDIDKAAQSGQPHKLFLTKLYAYYISFKWFLRYVKNFLCRCISI